MMFSKVIKQVIVKTENDEVLLRHRRQFLPAALEVEETPANPVGRAILKIIGLLFCIAIVWACIGKIDIVATAQGKIIPGERVKTIQPISIGKIKQIHIREGDEVRAGDPLVTLVGIVTKAELVRLKKEIAAVSLQLARQEAFTNYLDNYTALEAVSDFTLSVQTLSEITDESLLFEKKLLEQQVKDFVATSETLNSQLKSKAAEQKTVKAIATKLQRVLPIIEERTAALKSLYKKNFSSKAQYFELEQQRIELEEDIKAQQATVQQLASEQDEIRSQILTLHVQKRRESLDQQEQLRRQFASLKQEAIKAKELHDQQLIVSPIDGTVQQLQIYTVGGVVQPAQVLMQVVPKDSKMEVEAWIQNKDIGFVQEGQKAEVKVDTFNFTKYGLIDGLLVNVSNDAVADEKQGLRYLANVEIDKDWMQVENRKVKLAPGMSVSVEIKTGQRRIIEYFLSPLLRFKQESIRER